MDNKRSISRKISHWRCMIRSLGILFWVPFLVNDTIIPSVACMSYVHYGADEHTYSGIVYNVQMLSPFLSTFWIYLHLIQNIDVKGNEVFYVTNRMKIGEICFFYILYSITNTIFFVWYVTLYPSLIWEWLHLVIIYFFMAGMAYFLSYLLRSISVAMIPTLCYSFLSIAGSGSKAPVWSFYEPEGMSAFMFGTKYVWFILVGVLFFALGWILNKCYTSY